MLTCSRHRFATALQKQFESFREDEEKRINRLDLPQPRLLVFRNESVPFCFRLEKAITELKPTPINIDPATNFWTVYKKVADEHDDDLLSKYAGDLDTSLLFVSTFDLRYTCDFSTRSLSALGWFILCCRNHVHCPNHPITSTKPRRSLECPAAPNTGKQHFL